MVQSIPDKNSYSFITFDVIEFFPPITNNLMNKALDFAAEFDNICYEERGIINHVKKSTLINDNQHQGIKNIKTTV